jgi:hypothetical protein
MEAPIPSTEHVRVPCIISGDLRRQLQRAAQVRSTWVMVLFAPIIFVCFALLPASVTEGSTRGWIPILIFFGIWFFLIWLFTRFYCVRKVVCPNCGHSLWRCGTGNFKPRRIKVRKDASACPGCGIRIV